MGGVETWIDRLFVRTGTTEGSSRSPAKVWRIIAARSFGLAGGFVAIVVAPIRIAVAVLRAGELGTTVHGILYLLIVIGVTIGVAITGGVLWYLLVERSDAGRTGEDGRWGRLSTTGSVVGGVTGLFGSVGGVSIGLFLWRLFLSRFVSIADAGVSSPVLDFLVMGAYNGVFYLLVGGWLTIPLGALVGMRLGEQREAFDS